MKVSGIATLSLVLGCVLGASTQVLPPCPAPNSFGSVQRPACAAVEQFGAAGIVQQNRPVESKSHGYQVINTAPAAPRLSDPAAPSIDSPSTVQLKAAFASVRPEAAVAQQPAGLRHEDDDVGSAAPLTPRGKFEIFARHTFSPFTFASAAFDAGMSQASGQNRGFGGGVEGYGERYGATLADSESAVFFGKFLLPVILRQDPRYFRMREGRVTRRAFYAMSRIVVTRNDDGSSGFNTSHVLGRFISKAIANSYYPQRDRGFNHTLVNTGNGLLSDVETNLFREFWPDLREKIIPKRFRRNH